MAKRPATARCKNIMCKGGVTTDAMGHLRPCSRCNSDAFDAWAAERYQKNAKASVKAKAKSLKGK